jgi:hypothetical protein
MNFVARAVQSLAGKEVRRFGPEAACNAVEEPNRRIDAVQQGSGTLAAEGS